MQLLESRGTWLKNHQNPYKNSLVLHANAPLADPNTIFRIYIVIKIGGAMYQKLGKHRTAIAAQFHSFFFIFWQQIVEIQN